ncbi:hypothetical protein NJH49_02895 [Stenotrophomonas maltophilia]|uniref:hypothetical protein n=1 Tax=Stenotrophomonas maltophilia TaxID=40324 RepID=UPI002097EE57|nr:hypothetical protein [Stenotrophomonas maltophilia]MCO7399898.1 hypothetical protein [Stenotrophomonas maltophilia]MCO7410335.1 hypothetical protein [Stenotrophomonas maltophilia]
MQKTLSMFVEGIRQCAVEQPIQLLQVRAGLRTVLRHAGDLAEGAAPPLEDLRIIACGSQQQAEMGGDRPRIPRGIQQPLRSQVTERSRPLIRAVLEPRRVFAGAFQCQQAAALQHACAFSDRALPGHRMERLQPPSIQVRLESACRRPTSTNDIDGRAVDHRNELRIHLVQLG